ncbi:hypothetical protein LZ30DRAFT_743320 [Colletotrichum cereale]|nr:hypothetical protein LZ30DRAFT_743320 [Colletotrichum cereale]
MRWAFTLIIALASFLTASQPLFQKRGLCLGSVCLGKPKTKHYDFIVATIDSLINQYLWEGENEIPSDTDVPWNALPTKSATRKLRYRVWRVDGLGKTIQSKERPWRTKKPKPFAYADFSVYLQVEVTSYDTLDVRFSGLFDDKNGGRGWESTDKGLAIGSPYGRRTLFVIDIPGNQAETNYFFNGKWVKTKKHPR